jgi:F-type H+-transporting ATPase subunit a
MAVPAALTKAQAAEGDIDVNELVFGHIGDAYQWHIAKFGDTEVSIPLPVIVKSSTGWHVFSSARLEEGPYEGLYVAEGGAYDSKMYHSDDMERCIKAAGLEVEKIDDHLGMGHSIVQCRLK